MAPVSLEGQTLGKYRILEPLGRGGMAQVYKAYHPSLDRYVAIKVLRSDLVEESEFLSRFRREARSVANLRHPNIVQVYDFDVQDDFYFMVMELLEGDTLKAYLNAFRTRNERMPLGELTRILSDALAGLAYAHAEGVIHRDLKPANILLTRRGQAVLTDFGIAQILGGTQYTVSGALMGTLNYMAPEQGRDGKCDVRSDIYSLGIAYYEMLTGSVPFDADTPLAILMKHLNDPLPLPRALEPSVPEPFERVALKALAKDPDERYQSAEAMSQALTAAAQEAGIQVPAATTLPQTVAVSQVRPAAVAVFSGKRKAELADAGFASEDTDITFNPPKTGKTRRPGRGSRGALTWLTLMILGNMVLLWASGVFGWTVFGYAWPSELILVGLLFFLLMVESSGPWLLIPGGMLMGNGLLLTYYALTGRWEDWALLWPLEPLIVAGSIIAPFWLVKQSDGGRAFIRWFGTGVMLAAGITFFISLAVAIIRSL
ncbi:MAG: protein kinase [Chloroflexota bacterium]